MQSTLDIPKYTMNEEEEKKEILRKYRALLRALKPKLKPGSKEQIRVAFEMAAEAHKTMRRKSGEPYILHPLAVAMIAWRKSDLEFEARFARFFTTRLKIRTSPLI